MKPRLLIDSDVLAFIQRLKKSERDFLLRKFEDIRNAPAHHADFQKPDPDGRLLDVHVARRFAIAYWNDFADRHLKIMELVWADSRP